MENKSTETRSTFHEGYAVMRAVRKHRAPFPTFAAMKNVAWMSAEEAVRLVNSGDRVFIHGSAATPVRLVRALLDRHAELHDVELVSISTFGELGFERPEVQRAFFLNALFVSANMRATVDGPRGDYIPVFLSEIPRLFEQGVLPVDVALVHVSPPDRHGFCSLGVSVDVARSAVRNARTVIAQVNPNMPRTLGDGQVHVSRFAAMVQVDDALPEVDYAGAIGPTEERIARYISEMVDDGATLQMGIGAIPDAILRGLGGHKDLGVHTEMCSNGIIDLVEKGVVTNKFKKKQRGKIATAFAFGTRRLYDLVDDNPFFAFLDAQYVNDTQGDPRESQGGGREQRHRGGPHRPGVRGQHRHLPVQRRGRADGLHAGCRPQRRRQADHRPVLHHQQGPEQDRALPEGRRRCGHHPCPRALRGDRARGGLSLSARTCNSAPGT